MPHFAFVLPPNGTPTRLHLYVKKLQESHKEMQFLTSEETIQLPNNAPRDYRPLLLTAVLTGLRQGELLALRWEDIDFHNFKIRVRRTLWRGSFGPPKSHHSTRDVDMAPELRRVLSEHPTRFKGELVFCTDSGKPLDAHNLIRVFQRTLAKAGLRRVRFHDLRHTAVALNIAAGAHPKYIQAQMGHASITTTLNTYGHLLPSAFASQASRVQEMLFGHKEGTKNDAGTAITAEIGV